MLKTQFTASNNIVSHHIFKNKGIKTNMHNQNLVKNVLLKNEIKTFTKQRRRSRDMKIRSPPVTNVIWKAGKMEREKGDRSSFLNFSRFLFSCVSHFSDQREDFSFVYI